MVKVTLMQEEAIELLRDIAEENVMYIGRVSKKSEESLENFEKTNIEDAKEIMKMAKERKIKFLLPVDHVAYIKDKDKVVKTIELEREMTAFDIGKRTIKLFTQAIMNAKQVVWNGPVGKYEDPRFKKGTMKLAKAIAKSDAYSIVGGGDSVSAINACGVAKHINHLSTGGGASLKLMEGKVLPAVEVIDTI